MRYEPGRRLPGVGDRTLVLCHFILQHLRAFSLNHPASPNRLPEGRAGDGPAAAP